MDWKVVGEWLKTNAGSGAALVGALLTGNVPSAIAAGVSLVSTATGQADPMKALQALQTDPVTMIRLKELANQDEASIREHIRQMAEIEAKDAQAEHEQTQLTIRNGDNSEDAVVRRTRPYQSWASLMAAFLYVGSREYSGKDPSSEILLLLLALPWAYAGLRQVGKWSSDRIAAAMVKKG